MYPFILFKIHIIQNIYDLILRILLMYFQLKHNVSYMRKRSMSEKYLRRDENKILSCHESVQ